MNKLNVIRTDSFSNEVLQKLNNDLINLKTLSDKAQSTLKKLMSVFVDEAVMSHFDRVQQADILYTKLEPYATKFETLSSNHESAYLKLTTRLNAKADLDPESLREVFLICKQVGDVSKIIK